MKARLVLLGVIVLVASGATRPKTIRDVAMHQYALPAVELNPGPLAIDRNNDVWFAEEGAGRIGELRADGAMKIYRIPGAGEQLQAIVAARDGEIWFTQTLTADGSHNRVGYIASGGKIVIYRVPRNDAFVSSLSADPRGGVWIAEFGADRVARVTDAGRIREFRLPGPAGESVRSLASNADGSVWALQDHAIVRLSADGAARRFAVPLPASNAGMRNLAASVAAGRSSFWLTAYTQSSSGALASADGRAIWRFTVPNTVVRYPLRNSGLGPLELASGANGSVWMAYDGAPFIAHMSASGNVVDYRLPFRGVDVEGIAADNRGDVWFSNMQSEKIGVFGPRSSEEPRPSVAPLTREQSEIITAWRSTLRPRDGYDMAQVTADTLNVAARFAVVGWSDENGNAATLLRRSAGRWQSALVTNGNFYRQDELAAHGVPREVSAELLRDANVRLIPIPRPPRQ